MARMTVRNYFKPNAPQNGCHAITTTADGQEIWSCDKGEQLAVLRDGLLYRLAYNKPQYIEVFNKMNLTEKNLESVTQDAERVRGGESVTFRHSTPAQYELAGRLDEWHELGRIIEARKAKAEQFKLEKRSQEAAETEALYQKLLDAAADDFKNGGSIANEMFEGLLKRHGIKCPPKTLGWVRKSLCTISQNGYTHYRNSNPSTSVMGLAKELTPAIHAQAYAERNKTAGQN